MIKANELRIGNIINLGGNTLDTYQTYKPHIVCADTIKAIKEENDDNGDDYILSVFQPVELTPEILEASCGFSSFKKRKNLTLYYKNYIDDFCIEYTQYLGEFGFYLYGYRFPHKKIQYLHNLQNTHHSLKGEELQIDINKLNK